MPITQTMIVSGETKEMRLLDFHVKNFSLSLIFKMAQSNPANVIKFLHVIENLKVFDVE